MPSDVYSPLFSVPQMKPHLMAHLSSFLKKTSEDQEVRGKDDWTSAETYPGGSAFLNDALQPKFRFSWRRVWRSWIDGKLYIEEHAVHVDEETNVALKNHELKRSVEEPPKPPEHEPEPPEHGPAPKKGRIHADLK